MILILRWFLYFILPLTYFVYKWLKPWLRLAIFSLRLPGPRVTPLFGNIFQHKMGFIEFLNIAHSTYGPIIGSWASFYPVVLVIDPEYVRIILGNTKNLNKNFLYSALSSVSGSGIITSKVEEWKLHRKYMEPYFTSKFLEKCIPAFLARSQVLVNDLKDIKVVKITEEIRKYMLDVVHDIVLGNPLTDTDTRKKSTFTKRTNKAIEKMHNPWMTLKRLYKVTRDFIDDSQVKDDRENFIAEVMEQRKKDNAKNSCYLQYLMDIAESEVDFTEEDVIKEACTLMLTGQDSTLVTVSFVLFHLAKHPDIQEKVLEEINRVSSIWSEINMESLHELKYMGWCIKETMRLCPVAAVIGRKLDEDAELDDNLTLPAGSHLFIAIYALHRLPHVFPNPEKFVPERFSEMNVQLRPKFAYIPFGVGPRNCIAYKMAMISMKIVLFVLLKSYKFSLPVGDEKISLVYRVITRAKERIYLKVEAR